MLLIPSTINNIVLASLFSVLSVIFFIFMKAPDVAITEAAIGSAISTLILILASLYTGMNTSVNEKHKINQKIFYFFYILLGILTLTSYTTSHLPLFGDPTLKVHTEIAAFYTQDLKNSFYFENTVTAILGGYRGFDTMLETTVIMLSAFGVKRI